MPENSGKNTDKSLTPNAMSRLTVDENVPLAPHTTLKVGGPARFLARASTEEQIIDALEFARKRACPVFILGGGSNVLISDSGFPGLVLKIELPGIREEPDGSISAAAGEEWDAFVRHCVDRNLAGIECLSGIPGTVGGTPVQNVGAYGAEVGEVIARVRVLDRTNASILNLSGNDCGFAYRTSIFNSCSRDRFIVLRIGFSLRPGGTPRIRYQDLQRHFSGKTRPPGLQEVRDAVLQIRDVKGMVLRDQDPDSRSAGSFFKNPVLSPEQVSGVEEKARSIGILRPSERVPRFAAAGQEKVAAAWLVERAGFHKGFISGRAGISRKHSLAIINLGGAGAHDIVDLMRSIQERVHTLFGIDLLPEPVFIGNFNFGVRHPN